MSELEAAKRIGQQPAFPSEHQRTNFTDIHEGMTLRQYTAIAVLPTVMKEWGKSARKERRVDDGWEDQAAIAHVAIRFADALLEELAK